MKENLYFNKNASNPNFSYSNHNENHQNLRNSESFSNSPRKNNLKNGFSQKNVYLNDSKSLNENHNRVK